PHLARISGRPGLLDRAVPHAANAVMAETGTEQRECGEQHEHDYRIPPKQDRELGCHSEEHLLPLEPEVLERLGCTAIQHRRATLFSPPRRQIALGDPRGSTMRRRGQTRKRVLGFGERSLSLVEPILLEQSTTEHEPCVADLVEHVVAIPDDLERVASLLL